MTSVPVHIPAAVIAWALGWAAPAVRLPTGEWAICEELKQDICANEEREPLMRRHAVVYPCPGEMTGQLLELKKNSKQWKETVNMLTITGCKGTGSCMFEAIYICLRMTDACAQENLDLLGNYKSLRALYNGLLRGAPQVYEDTRADMMKCSRNGGTFTAADHTKNFEKIIANAKDHSRWGGATDAVLLMVLVCRDLGERFPESGWARGRRFRVVYWDETRGEFNCTVPEVVTPAEGEVKVEGGQHWRRWQWTFVLNWLQHSHFEVVAVVPPPEATGLSQWNEVFGASCPNQPCPVVDATAPREMRCHEGVCPVLSRA